MFVWLRVKNKYYLERWNKHLPVISTVSTEKWRHVSAALVVSFVLLLTAWIAYCGHWDRLSLWMWEGEWLVCTSSKSGSICIPCVSNSSSIFVAIATEAVTFIQVLSVDFAVIIKVGQFVIITVCSQFYISGNICLCATFQMNSAPNSRRKMKKQMLQA